MMSSGVLTDKVAIVTGAAGGMGRAIALAFAAEGARVAVSDIAADGGNETVEMVREAGGEARFFATDVADAPSVEELVAGTVTAFGGLHCAVNGAAIELEREPLADVDEETFDRIIAVNLKSIFLCMKYEIRQMLTHGGGAIVNIASTNSIRPQPHQSAYTASKHGVLGMTKNAAIDYAAARDPDQRHLPRRHRHADAAGRDRPAGAGPAGGRRPAQRARALR